ncbi:uncharacterized protein LOC123720118 [Pieris brassicae]|uniref:uncharacterized protein LOC123720118 n=1 Tax=Pieris brassicae TaxID=7116 RepID=UPI001E65FD10|nr:uncharacterized protein LOC123720118 [Pieris brassicae]
MKSLLGFVFLFTVKFGFSQNASYLDTIRHLPQTRRILRGSEVGDTRPYMVYLRPASTESKVDANWLCGGVIVDAQYIITSAACIEDVRHFYVISGTHRWIPKDTEDECIRNGKKKAIWKCVPQNYVFDGNVFDNIRWMINDIAVVRVEDDFNFERRIRGCDFVPKVISYNNRSEELENAGIVASIAGWGSVDNFGDVYGRMSDNSPDLLETDVVLISKKSCKNRWPERYHHIIDSSMVCAKDSTDDNMNDLCKDQEISCKELVYSDELEETRRFVMDPNSLRVHSARHNETRRSKVISGGFCENDHGGPLVVGYGTGAVVVGVISACQTANITQKCYGPYLYTSVWKNRHLIQCAIHKNIEASCKLLLRTSKTRESVFNWNQHPDGKAKIEIKKPVPVYVPQQKPKLNATVVKRHKSFKNSSKKIKY